METTKEQNTQLQKSKRKKSIKRKNYKAEYIKLKSEFNKHKNTVSLDYTKSLSIDFSFIELFWLKNLIGDKMIEMEEDLVYYDDDDKLPPKKQGHKYVKGKLKVLEAIFEKLDCLTI